jgi:hypothetical protein
MAEVWYTIVRRFGPDWGERVWSGDRSPLTWQGYLEWSGLRQLDEVVSLDTMLCEPAVPPDSEPLTIEDWKHVVNRDFRLHFYRNLDYLLSRVSLRPELQLLGAIEGPPEGEMPALDDPRFIFLGYEVLDVHGDVSALTNCGGFPLAFDGAELNRFGLIDEPGRAYGVQRALRAAYPGEHHAECDVWAVWRMEDDRALPKGP